MLRPLWEPPPRKRARGGWRQVQAQAVEEDDEYHGVSRLAAGVLLDWCDGDLFASKLQTRMSDAVSDNFKHPMIVRLSEIGSGQNAHGGLMTLCERLGITDFITARPNETVSHFVLPSAYIRMMHTHYKRDFD